MRRSLLVATATLVVLLALAGPVVAAGTTLAAPDGDVTGPTPVAVEVRRDNVFEPIEYVEVRLHRGDEALGPWTRLRCERGCARDQVDRRYALPDGAHFDPATGAPLAERGPLPNGTYVLRGRIEKGFERQPFHHELHLAVPPRAPAGVTAAREDGEVVLRWDEGPEPDLLGYRVERRDGDDWEPLATTDEARHRDQPAAGEHRYRVVALRPDGRGAELEAASEAVAVEVPEDDADGSDGSGGGDAGDEDAGEGEAGGDRDGDGRPDEGEVEASASVDGGEGRGDGDRDGGAGGGGAGGGSASAPSLGSRGSGSIPTVDGGGQDGYDDELDYGSVAGDGEGGDEVTVAAPGGWRGSVDGLLDPDRLAVPIAVGLVLTATGLHLWRWLRVPLP